MAETLTTHGPDGGVWRWVDMVRDLEEQGGLKGVKIDPLSLQQASCMGEFEGNHFLVSWKVNSLLMISMIRYSEPLIAAFSKVVEYQPFCKYTQEVDGHQLTVVEWAKHDVASRFSQLVVAKTQNLKRLNMDETPSDSNR